MKEHKDELEDLFRDRFSADEAPLSPKVWENIKQTLPEKNGIGFLKGPLLSGVLALTIVGVGWGLFRSFTHKENIHSLNKNHNRTIQADRPGFALAGNKNSSNEKWQTPYDRGVQSNGYGESFISESKRAKKNTDEYKPTVSNSDLSYSTPQGNDANRGFSNKQETLSYKQNEKPSNEKSYVKNENAQKQLDDKNRALVNTNNPFGKQLKTTRFTKSEGKEEATTNPFPEKEGIGQHKLRADQLGKKEGFNDLGKMVKDATHDAKEKDIRAEEKDQLSRIPAAGDETAVKQGVSEVQLSDTKSGNNERVEGSGKIENSLLASGLQNSEAKNEIAPKSSIETKADSVLPEPMEDTLSEKIIDSIARPDSMTKKEKTKEIRSSRWSVDVLLAPALTGVASKAENTSYETQVASKNSQSKNIVTLSGGLAVNYSFGSNWSVSTGMFYSVYSEKYNFKNTVRIDSSVYGSHIRYDSIFRDSNNVKIFDSIAQTVVQDTTVHSRKQEYSAQKKDRYSFLSFPVNVSYCFLRRNRITLSATAGIRVNLLLKGTTYISNREMTDLFNYQWKVQKVTLSYMASVSMEYVLWKNISLLAQPVVNYHGSSIYSGSSPIRQRPYSIGVNAGLRIRF